MAAYPGPQSSPSVSVGKPSPFLLLLSLVGIVALTVFGEACTSEQKLSPLPGEIHGLKLQRQFTGQEAAQRIARLHGKPVAPEESYIGHYGIGAGHAMLYVSGFEFKDQANALLAAMSLRIGEGSSGFGHHKQFRVKERQVHMVLGQGQVHYFFTKGERVYWLAVAPRMARPALAEMLEVDVETVPTLDSILSEL